MSRRIVPATPARTGRKPRVLLVDDHRQVLDMVAAILAPEFDVVGATTDGHQGIAEAARLKPDVIVLDVEMPGLDGFQTLRTLAEGSSRSVPPVVFLSTHGTEEVVSKALRQGGRGYVLKRRVARDLVTALEQVLLGRQFVPSLGPLVTTGHTHVMQIYGQVESFAEDVAAVFDAALRRGEATCAIATRPLRDSLGDRLRARGWNVDELSGHKRCLLIEAEGAISRFMRDGLPDRGCLAEMARELEAYRRAESNGGASPLTLVGNMVVSLCEADNPPAAVALESHWNDLTRDLPFVTICGYSTSCFHRRGVPHLWRDACAEHGALSHADDV